MCVCVCVRGGIYLGGEVMHVWRRGTWGRGAKVSEVVIFLLVVVCWFLCFCLLLGCFLLLFFCVFFCVCVCFGGEG